MLPTHEIAYELHLKHQPDASYRSASISWAADNNSPLNSLSYAYDFQMLSDKDYTASFALNQVSQGEQMQGFTASYQTSDDSRHSLSVDINHSQDASRCINVEVIIHLYALFNACNFFLCVCK